MDPLRFALQNGGELLIRQATPEDAADIISYVQSVGGESDFVTFGPGEFEIGEDEERKLLQASFEAPNNLFLIGLIDDRIIATAHLEASQRPRICHSGTIGMSVSKSHWGKGVGGAILDALIGWARGTGIIRKVNLHVRTDNERALRLYQHKGFVTEGRVTREMAVDGKFFDAFHMGLEI